MTILKVNAREINRRVLAVARQLNILAVLHSMIGIGVINGVVSQFGTNMLSDAAITAGIVLFLYGLYFLATYFGSKNMIRERKR